MTTLRIGGVPEHFNYPWKYAIDQQSFARQNINLIWQDFPGGTGAMVSALKKDEIDMALLLTEGAVKEISLGAEFKIVTPYVESPLIWGIHSAKSEYSISELGKYKYAVSRIGSGSHLMAYIHAKLHNVQLKEEQMVIVGTISGAREALACGKADLFFWEKFMTKPIVDSGEFFLVDQIPTPWPCFMLVANNKTMQQKSNSIVLLLDILHNTLKELNNTPNLSDKIAEIYHLKNEDVKTWLGLTRWSKDKMISIKSLEKVINSLTEIGMLNQRTEIRNLVFDPTCLN